MPAHKMKKIGGRRKPPHRHKEPKKVDIDKRLNGARLEAPPRGCPSCFGYLEEISRLTKIIQNLKTKVSYYETAADNTRPKSKNPYNNFTKMPTLPKHIKPEKSPSFNRHNTTLHVYPPSARPSEKTGNPTDWFAPEVLIAPPDYYNVENSGPSSEESESEPEEEVVEGSRTPSVAGSQGASAPSSKAASVNEDEEGASRQGDGESQVDDQSQVDDEGVEEQSQCAEWEDRFPYEENLFHLSRDFQIEHRIATAEDAIVYKAIRRKTGEEVAIKFRDEWNRRGKHPKELRLLSAVQGHPATCELICWHSLPNTKCHAIVTRLYPNTDIEQYLFDNPIKIRKYMHGMLESVKFLHNRNVLYRDIKPSNVLWDEENQRSMLIDFDVATFYNPKLLHRRCVGTDGYMAPEVLLISNAFDELEKQERYRDGKNREELLSKLPLKGYDLQVDVYSSGVLFGQLLFCYPEEDITDDDNTEASGEGMTLRATRRLGKLSKLREWENGAVEGEEEEDQPRRMTLSEYREFLALDLLVKMLKPDPTKRISVADALQHHFFTQADVFPHLAPLVVPWDKAPLPALHS